MDLKLDLSKLDKRQKFMLAIVGAVAVAAGFYYFYYEPSQRAVAELRQQIAAKDTELNTARTQAAMVKKLEKEITELEKQLGIFRAKTASSAEIIPLIKTIEEEAQRLDLKVLNMATTVQEPLLTPPPGSPPPSGQKGPGAQAQAPTPGLMPGYTKVSFNINLQGKYKNLEDFLKTLQNIATFLTVEEVTIRSDENIYPELTSKLDINAYSKKGGVVDAIARGL